MRPAAEGRATVPIVTPEPHPLAATTTLTALLEAWLAGAVTTLETGRRIERRHARDVDIPASARTALMEVFPPYPASAPDPDIVRLILRALEADEPADEALIAVTHRRPLLEAVVTLDPDDALVETILRPGERVLLGTPGGRRALAALLEGDGGPFEDWLDRVVLDAEAFAGTTGDVPLLGLEDLDALVRRLALATETLQPGPARVMVADEWVAETTVAALAEDVPLPEVARVTGEVLLERSAPILLWHAAHELALVAEDDPALALTVLQRCLPVGTAEAGRCPAEAAAPLLGELAPTAAVDVLDGLAPRLDADAWAAIARGFLRSALSSTWADWRDPVRAWADGDDTVRAVAVVDALVRGGAPEPGALAWFIDAPVPAVRAACRTHVGLTA